jgi:PiT family inorganic phosphate transporter
MSLFLFLSGGLLLGWSLGANDAANVFGTAVGTKMVKFKTAAIVASIFVILGAVISGSGTSHSLGELGAVNEIAGAFIVTFAAGFTVYSMVKVELPVSTTQAIVGAIIGWNIFSGSLTDYTIMSTIIATWIICPVLAALFSFIIYNFVKFALHNLRIHLLRLDFYTRVGLLIVGAFGSYSLGANNISNVMGVFITSTNFKPLDLRLFTLTSTEQLFLIGGISIAAGIITYSYKVMKTVGARIIELTPEAALVVVTATSLVLFLFSSQNLENFLAVNGLPTIPLVPVSSSQAVVGAVIGIGLARGARNINLKIIFKISSGWVTTPVIAGMISLVSLFVMQNVFNQKVYKPYSYIISEKVINRLEEKNLAGSKIRMFRDMRFNNEYEIYDTLKSDDTLSRENIIQIIEETKIDNINISFSHINTGSFNKFFTPAQMDAVKSLDGRKFNHAWEMNKALSEKSAEWEFKPGDKKNKIYNSELKSKLLLLKKIFSS